MGGILFISGSGRKSSFCATDFPHGYLHLFSWLEHRTAVLWTCNTVSFVSGCFYCFLGEFVIDQVIFEHLP